MPMQNLPGLSIRYISDDGLHREDGPAVEYIGGSCKGDKYWWLDGKCLDVKTQEQFELYMRLKVFW